MNKLVNKKLNKKKKNHMMKDVSIYFPNSRSNTSICLLLPSLIYTTSLIFCEFLYLISIQLKSTHMLQL